MPKNTPSHTQSAFIPETFQQIVRWATAKVVEHKVDAIAACGHSGLLVAGGIALQTGLPIIAIRKASEVPVADHLRVNTNDGDEESKYSRWAFVDDCISSGSTLLHVIKEIDKAEIATNLFPVASILYGQDSLAVDTDLTGSREPYRSLIETALSREQQDRFKEQLNNRFPYVTRYFDSYNVVRQKRRAREQAEQRERVRETEEATKESLGIAEVEESILTTSPETSVWRNMAPDYGSASKVWSLLREPYFKGGTAPAKSL